MVGLPNAPHAVVTGAARGIGREIALQLSKAGAVVTALGRQTAALEELVTQGIAHSFVAADVTDPAAVDAAMREAAARRPIDILIANAGAAESASFAKSDAALFARMMDVNFMGVVHSIQAALPSMRGQPFGRVVVIASTAGLKGYAYVSAYAAAKHAAIGLVRSLALELASTRVTVNAVCPGFTDTDLVAGSLDTIMKKTGRDRAAATAELTRHNPQGRLISPAEVADTVLWLCGENAAAVTGQAIAVAGGEI
jgi:NAD(P)-dependent dehydrogenase (short-subunit alcohol dehydrogenase family)